MSSSAAMEKIEKIARRCFLSSHSRVAQQLLVAGAVCGVGVTTRFFLAKLLHILYILAVAGARTFHSITVCQKHIHHKTFATITDDFQTTFVCDMYSSFSNLQNSCFLFYLIYFGWLKMFCASCAENIALTLVILMEIFGHVVFFSCHNFIHSHDSSK